MMLVIETCVLCDHFGDDKTFEIVKKAGFDGIDYTFFNHHGQAQLEGDYMAHAAGTKALLEKHGLLCRQSHAPFAFRYEHGDWEKSKLWEDMNHSIEYAAFLGAKQIIIHPVNVPEGVDFVEYNTRYLKSFEPTARSFGINIAIENGPRARILNQVLAQLDSPYYVCCIDVGHANNPDCGVTPQSEIADVAPGMLQALHLHDNHGVVRGTTSWDQHYLPFIGIMDWDAILRTLAERRYPGDMTLEIVGFMEHLPSDVLPETALLAGAIGRHLIRKYQSFLQGCV